MMEDTYTRLSTTKFQEGEVVKDYDCISKQIYMIHSGYAGVVLREHGSHAKQNPGRMLLPKSEYKGG
jgi:hypothetical protein